MKKWISEFIDDMRHIWREFRVELKNANSVAGDECHDELEVNNPLHGPGWNAVPDLDPRKPVNNLDNPYSHDMRHTDFHGFHKHSR